MKLLTVAAALLFLTGCSSMVSLNSFAPEQELDPTLLGTWHDKQEAYVIAKAGQQYAITYTDKDTVLKCKARLLEAGGARILDLYPEDESPLQLAAHTPVRIWPSGNAMDVAILDSEWLRDLAVKQLASQTVNQRLVITAPGQAVRSFLLQYGPDERAYTERNTLYRAE